jgi:flagellar motor switch protein FliM
MGEVLSQSEIDSLLNAISSGEMPTEELTAPKERKIENYDFARPSKFSKDHLRTLEIIYEDYARILSTKLPIYLRKNVQVEVLGAEAVTFSEFLVSSSYHTVFGIMNFEPLPGNTILLMSTEVVYAILERLLGGSGKSIKKTREFSDIELSIIEKIFNMCIENMGETWSNVVDINVGVERVETNSQFIQMYQPNEMTALVSMNVVMGDVSGRMIMCIPFTCVEPIIDKLNTKYWYSVGQEEDNDEFQENIKGTLNHAFIPIRVNMGNSIISVNEFRNLQRGDIIKLNTRVDDELDVIVGNMKKFTAIPGASHDAYAVRIKSIIREEQ